MSPEEIVRTMLQGDAFSRWLGIELLELRAGYCRLRMQVRTEMLNGFSIAHGGITYSLADSALAFAANAKGRKSLSVETSIAHVKSLKAGDWLEAEAQVETETERMGFYRVDLSSPQHAGEKVALFRGTVYKTASAWGSSPS